MPHMDRLVTFHVLLIIALKIQNPFANTEVTMKTIAMLFCVFFSSTVLLNTELTYKDLGYWIDKLLIPGILTTLTAVVGYFLTRKPKPAVQESSSQQNSKKPKNIQTDSALSQSSEANTGQQQPQEPDTRAQSTKLIQKETIVSRPEETKKQEIEKKVVPNYRIDEHGFKLIDVKINGSMFPCICLGPIQETTYSDIAGILVDFSISEDSMSLYLSQCNVNMARIETRSSLMGCYIDVCKYMHRNQWLGALLYRIGIDATACNDYFRSLQIED